MAIEHRNEISIVGRVSGEAVPTVLPSGDEVTTVRVVVERPRAPAGRGSRQRVDTFTCSAWTPQLRRVVRSWYTGDIVEIQGQLRRRFWRNENVPQSRYEIEVNGAQMVAMAAPDPPSGQVSAPTSG